MGIGNDNKDGDKHCLAMLTDRNAVFDFLATLRSSELPRVAPCYMASDFVDTAPQHPNYSWATKKHLRGNKKMKALSIQIVPAQAGFLTVYDFADSKEVDTGEPVIAWRVETYNVKDRDDVFSQCVPLTVDGDADSNCIGVQNPDLTVTVFEDSTYRSLAELRLQKYPK